MKKFIWKEELKSAGYTILSAILISLAFQLMGLQGDIENAFETGIFTGIWLAVARALLKSIGAGIVAFIPYFASRVKSWFK